MAFVSTIEKIEVEIHAIGITNKGQGTAFLGMTISQQIPKWIIFRSNEPYVEIDRMPIQLSMHAIKYPGQQINFGFEKFSQVYVLSTCYYILMFMILLMIVLFL